MQVFLSGAHNRPSGGTKVINQTARLFSEKGHRAYVVIPGEPYRARFISDPAETIGFADMVSRCRREDIIIDGWPLKESWEATKKAKAERKVFWQHGASIPIGWNFVGPKIFAPDSIYTHHWNVSGACRDYLQGKYNLSKIDIVHPFFNTPSLNKYASRRHVRARRGILCLGARGSSVLPYILRTFSPRTKITVIYGRYHEEEFFRELLCHKFLVSLDQGIGNPPFWFRLKRRALSLVSARERYKNFWLVPPGHLLGFPMPPAEAAVLGTVVIGFAMGGGLEWMSEQNCFLAKDRNLKSLLLNIKRALNTSKEELQTIAERGFRATSKFTKAHTWQQICSSLEI